MKKLLIGGDVSLQYSSLDISENRIFSNPLTNEIKNLNMEMSVEALVKLWQSYIKNNNGFYPSWLIMHPEDFESYQKVIQSPKGLENTSDDGMRFQTMRIVRTVDIEKGQWFAASDK